MDLSKDLALRELPPLKSRKDIKEILQTKEYGRSPNVDCKLSTGKAVGVYDNYRLGKRKGFLV